MNELKRRFDAFFHQSEIPYGIALTRMAISIVMLFVMGSRWIQVREYFSTDGAVCSLTVHFGHGTLLPVFPPEIAIVLFTVMLCCLFTSAIGFMTRTSLILTTILFTYFCLQDGLSTITKYSVITTHIFLLLSMSNCGDVWSVDRWLLERRYGKNSSVFVPSASSSLWATRLMQMFIGIVYFGAAITKMHTPSFFTGQQLRYWMLTNVNHYNPVGEVLALFPAMLVLFGYIAIVWEVMFIFQCWKGIGRILSISLGVMFHLMTTLTLGLFVFPAVCLSIYFCFVNEADVLWVRKQCRKIPSLLQIASWSKSQLQQLGQWVDPVISHPTAALTAFAIFLGSSSGIAVAAEYLIDPYGLRRAEGKYQLQPLSYEQAHRLLTPAKKLDETDMLMSFDIGKYAIGGMVTQASLDFHHGDHIYCQAHFTPPHGDMYIECNLHEKDGPIIDHVDSIVTRDGDSATFCYDLFEPLGTGEFELVFKGNGKELARKTFTLSP